MVLAWLGTIALCAIQLLMVRYGGGVNIHDVPETSLTEFLDLFLDVQMVARTAMFFARLSILLLYVRIFFPLGTVRTMTWWVIQVTIWANLLYTISLIFVTTLQCVPRGLPFGSTCVDQWLVLVLASVINVVTDIAVILIPVRSIWKLQMSRKRKWAIGALFAFGALAPIASLARLCYQIPMADNPDKTVLYSTVMLLATAEQGVAMIIGSAPVCSTLLLRIKRGRRPSGPRQNATMSQRIWPSRERKVGTTPKRRKTPDPFRITTDAGTNSSEALHTLGSDRHNVVEHQESVELTDSKSWSVGKG
ncbi:hypothetical protein F4780DRAFT_771391 [Xylariomycetidae sp. FL0641]|nr:hypothetical protein F4780DRAFT_771391 [Xylariomycetidae sp. FL0641]